MSAFFVARNSPTPVACLRAPANSCHVRSSGPASGSMMRLCIGSSMPRTWIWRQVPPRSGSPWTRREIIHFSRRPQTASGCLNRSGGAGAGVGLLFGRSVECRLQVIMPQAEILLRGRSPRLADDHPPPRRSSKETRRSGFFELKSLSDRHGKQNGRLIDDRRSTRANRFASDERAAISLIAPCVIPPPARHPPRQRKSPTRSSAFALVTLAPVLESTAVKLARGWPEMLPSSSRPHASNRAASLIVSIDRLSTVAGAGMTVSIPST